jgi:uncharacterized membrane protein (DUF2068 family)
MSQRPTGITILAVLAVIGGLISLFFGGFVAFLGPHVGVEMTEQTGDAAGSAYGGLMTLMGVGFLAHGLLQFVTAYGLFTLKRWAWLLAVIMQLVSLVLDGIQGLRGQVSGSVIAALIAAGILYYLFRPHVKRSFGRA